jgi:minor extracellular serine protease Vpr
MLLSALPLFSADRGSGRYIVILEDPPLAQQFPSSKDRKSAAAVDQRRKIEAAQQTLRRKLEARKIEVLGSVQTILNALFVQATEAQAAEVRKLPGVKSVQLARRMKRSLDKAVPLVNGPAAWNTLGGVDKAGAGIKIGILDTGIDQSQPGLQDPSLPMPDGFPKCEGQDCAYTNNKVIVARSYVGLLAAGSGSNPAANSRPDDLSPRDRVGHGTAVAMIAAGKTNSGPVTTITGVAPKAYLGNYKIFGSPGVNDYTYSDVVLKALEDAAQDGMDVVNLSLVEFRATYGPLDQSASICGGACDALALAAENAMLGGLTVVVSAGNDGGSGTYYPARNSINTPGTAPSAITVGASTNSHALYSRVLVTGDGVPPGLQSIYATLGDGPKPTAPLTAPLRDVASLGNDGFACAALASGSLSGSIALIQRGNCSFFAKVLNAANAGAAGVVLYQPSGYDFITQPQGLTQTTIPSAMITNTDGVALKTFLKSNADRPATLDPTLQVIGATPDTVAYFSSEGPAISTFGIKPELVAPGTDIYTATQKYDPNSDMYGPTGYGGFQGTSYAAAMVTGTAALVKQNNSKLTAGQLKSTVVNTATQDVTDYYGTASVLAVGAGKLNAGAAVQTNITVEPATLSFGIITSGSLPKNPALKITNISGNPVSLTLRLVASVPDSRARLGLSSSSLSLDSGQSGMVTVTLSGSIPNPGAYEGALQIQGGAVPLSVPYLYLATDGVPANGFPVLGSDFTGVADEAGDLIGLKLVDRFGVPIQGWPVVFGSTFGGGRITRGDAATDIYGIAAAQPVLGAQLGDQEFAAQAIGAGLTVFFDGTAIQAPAIASNGVVNAASGEAGKGVAPGSYISIFGSALSPTTKVESTAYLPVSLAGVSVSFDDPPSSKSFPGHLHFVSPGQINVQIPWEFQGLSSVLMKVSIGDISSAVYTVQLADYSPAAFEYTDPASGERLAAVLDEKFALVGSSNPAQRGHVIQIYANGLGPVDNQPASGEPSPASPTANTRSVPTVTIGGSPASVQFSGLTPYSIGLYQLNVLVPEDAPTGTQPVVITANGIASKTANIPVQ